MSGSNKTADRRFIDEAWNRGEFDVIDELFAADYVNRTPRKGFSPDRDGLRRMIGNYRIVFPDIHLDVDDVVVGGDRIATRWTMSGTHTGPGLGVPPTGRKFRIRGMAIHRYRRGRIIETWNVIDDLGLLRQLGVVPSTRRAG